MTCLIQHVLSCLSSLSLFYFPLGGAAGIPTFALNPAFPERRL